ncbi:MAG: O-antigen ligase family protein [Desulfuromonadales bacterium]
MVGTLDNTFFSAKSERMLQVVLFLVFAFFFLQPVGKSFEVPFAILALLGVIGVVRQPRLIFEDQRITTYGCLFLSFFVPVLLSCYGAINLSEAARVTAGFIRIFFAGFIVIRYFSSVERFRLLDAAFALVLLLWLLDGVFQAVFGHDVFGGIPPEGRLGSVFIKHPLKFGLMAAVFSPFLLVSAARRGSLWLFLALLLSGGIVFWAGSRGGWIAFALVVAGLFAYHILVTKKISYWFVAFMLLCLVVTGSVGYVSHAPLRAKVDQTLLVLKGDEQSINQAITYRVPIWRTAWRMYAENPVNGVGARGFRYAYEQYSLQKDLIVEPHSTAIGAYHAHQLLMDVAAETGSLGLTGLLASVIILCVVWFRAPRQNKDCMLPYGLALLAALFPLNTHFATYSSSWSATIFLLMALFCAASQSNPGQSCD